MEQHLLNWTTMEENMTKENDPVWPTSLYYLHSEQKNKVEKKTILH